MGARINSVCDASPPSNSDVSSCRADSVRKRPVRGCSCAGIMTSVRILRAVKERGPLGAFEQFFKLRTFKFGRLVGVDALGNKYYENTEEYKHGTCRTRVAGPRALVAHTHRCGLLAPGPGLSKQLPPMEQTGDVLTCASRRIGSAVS